jgi:hypothetical protein
MVFVTQANGGPLPLLTNLSATSLAPGNSHPNEFLFDIIITYELTVSRRRPLLFLEAEYELSSFRA